MILESGFRELERLGGEELIKRLIRGCLRIEIEGDTYWDINDSGKGICIDVPQQLIYLTNPTLRVVNTPYYCALLVTNPLQVYVWELGNLTFTPREGGYLNDVTELPLELSYTYQCEVDTVSTSPLYVIRCKLKWLL